VVRFFDEKEDFKESNMILDESPKEQYEILTVSEGTPSQMSFLRQDEYREIAREALINLLKITGQNANWDYLYEHDGVKIWRKKQLGPNTIGCKGTCRVDASPLSTLRLLQDYQNRSQWDDLCNDAEIIEAISDSVNILRISYRSSNWWWGSKTDICAVGQSRVLPDGTCLLALSSVQHPKCGLASGYVRAKLILCGWIVRPYIPRSEKDSPISPSEVLMNSRTPVRNKKELEKPSPKEEPKRSEVTTVMIMDLRQKFPAPFLNRMSTTYPANHLSNLKMLVKSKQTMRQRFRELDLFF